MPGRLMTFLCGREEAGHRSRNSDQPARPRHDAHQVAALEVRSLPMAEKVSVLRSEKYVAERAAGAISNRRVAVAECDDPAISHTDTACDLAECY